MFSLSNVWVGLPNLFIYRSISCSSSYNSLNHYMTLGITPAASQEEIKRAYFELCKKHHPDKTDGSVESTKMFRLITEAYEVLGNEKLRQAYDKKMCYGRDMRKENLNFKRKEDYYYNAEKLFHDRVNPRKVYTGKTWQYDFDAWTRAHYPSHGKTKEENLKMKAERRRNWRNFNSSESQSFEKLQNKRFIVISIFLMAGFSFAISILSFVDPYSKGISFTGDFLNENNKDNKTSEN